MKTPRWFFAFLMLCCIGTTSAADGSDASSGPSTNDFLYQARKSIDLRDWPNASDQLGQALRAEPQNPDVLNLLGYYHRKKPTPDLTLAFDFYKKALAIDPGHKGAHEYVGEAYLMAKQPEEARKHLAILERLCGNRSCEEYQDLARALAQYQPAQ